MSWWHFTLIEDKFKFVWWWIKICHWVFSWCIDPNACITEHNRPEKTNLSKKTYQRKQRISDLTISLEHNCFITYWPMKNVSAIQNGLFSRIVNILPVLYKFVMTSWNGNIFRITGHLCRGIHWSLVNSQRPVTRSFLICAWTNSWASNRDAGD